jgi:hypothetical protein
MPRLQGICLRYRIRRHHPLFHKLRARRVGVYARLSQAFHFGKAFAFYFREFHLD